jgi:uncharacterized protein YbjT (DUF2867 family)
MTIPFQHVLVTGATGYIGGRLVPQLLLRGHRVRCLARDPDHLVGRWPEVEVAGGDVLRPETLPPALQGIEAAYYLIHSMAAGEHGFAERDLEAADNFARAAHAAGVQRIIYLGGLGLAEDTLSPHLRSRQETGQRLAVHGVPVTEFRAGVIVGSGSLSFELIRYLAERLPLMICPRWIQTRIQPIGVLDVMRYLTDCLEVPESAGRILEIGGRDILSYADMVRVYARVRGLRRRLVHVPILTPRLSSYWINIVTPIPMAIARPLIEGLRNEVIVHDDTARQMFDFEPMSYEAAVRLALERWVTGQVKTVWSSSSAAFGTDSHAVHLSETEGLIQERRQLACRAPATRVFRVCSSLGGRRGWLYANWLWRVRGLMDRLIGGVGMRRGRRSPHQLRVGDAVDFWRVEALEPDRLLCLRAEMKLPGQAWLQFQVQADGDDRSILTQIAFFEPKGLFGSLYWTLLYPLHQMIFRGLARAVVRCAERRSPRRHKEHKGHQD